MPNDPARLAAEVDTAEIREALADAQAALADFEDAIDRLNEAEFYLNVFPDSEESK